MNCKYIDQKTGKVYDNIDEYLNSLSDKELTNLFAEKTKENKASSKSAFSPTEQIFNDSNKASNTMLANVFVESSEEFFKTLVSNGVFEGSNQSAFSNPGLSSKDLYNNVIDLGLRDLISNEHYVDLLRVLGLIKTKKNVEKLFENKSLAEKITELLEDREVKEYIKDRDSFLRYFKANAYLNKSKNKFIHDVKYLQPKNGITKNALAEDFAQAVFDVEAFAKRHKISLNVAKKIQSIAKDAILYSYGLNNFSFSFGGISKIFNKEILNEKFDFLNMSIADGFHQNRLKKYANFTEMSYIDQDEFKKNLSMINPSAASRIKKVKPQSVVFKNIDTLTKGLNSFFNKINKKEYMSNELLEIKTGGKTSTIVVYSSNTTNNHPTVVNHGNQVFFKNTNSSAENIITKAIEDSSADTNILLTNISTYRLAEKENKAVILDANKNRVVNNAAAEIYNMFIGLKHDVFEDAHNNTLNRSGKANKPIDRDIRRSKFSTNGNLFRTEKTITSSAEKLKGIFEKAGIKVNIIYDSEIDEKGTAQWVSDKEVNITINLDKATNDTSPHEFSHIFADIVGVNHPVMKRAIAFLKETPLWDEVASLYPELSGDDLAKEVIATAMGISAAKKLNKENLSRWQRIKNGIKAFFKRLFRFKSMSPVDELIDMMYNQDFNVVAADIVLSEKIPMWKSKAGITADGKIKKARKSVEKILSDVSSKIGTLKAKDRPYQEKLSNYKEMKEAKFNAMDFSNKYIAYMIDVKNDIDKIYKGVVNAVAILKNNPNALDENKKKRTYDAIIQLIDDLKTFENVSKELSNYYKIAQEFKILKDANDKSPEADRISDAEIVRRNLLDSSGKKFKYETEEDLLSKIIIGSDKSINNKLALINKLAALVDLNTSFNHERKSLYGNGSYEHGLLRDLINDDLVRLSTNPDMLDGTIKNLFELKKTRFTLPYDETSIQRWLDALKDTNNPLVALTLKQYFQEQFIASKNSEDEVKEFKKMLEEYKSKGFSVEQLIDKNGRLIDDLDYEAYQKLKKEAEDKGNISHFLKVYNRIHPDYKEIIKNKAKELGGSTSPAYLEWYKRNHKTVGKRDFPTRELSVPDTRNEEIRNKRFDELSKNKEWLKYRDYFKNILKTKSQGFNSSLLNEGFLPSVTKDKKTLLEQLKEKKDRIFNTEKKDKYVLTDENNNIVLVHNMPYLKWLYKGERPKLDENKKDDKKAREKYKQELRNYNLEKRLAQKDLALNDFDLIMEIFIRAQNNHKFKKSNDSKLVLIRELVKDHYLHRTNGIHEAYNAMVKKNTGENEASKVSPENLLSHLDDWIRMVHYDDMNFGDGQRWKTELTSLIMNITSYSAMGFNIYSAANNLLHGNLQLAVERYAKEFFSVKSWKQANAIAAKSVFYKSGSDNSKDGAIMNYFDVFSDQNELMSHLKDKGFIDKFKDANFYMQNAGEQQLQNTTLFSVLMETPVRVKQEDGSYKDGFLYDNTEVLNGKIFWGEKVEIQNEKKEWVKVDKNQISRLRNRVISINQYLYGIYNKEDLGAINQFWYGRLAMHFKKWMRPGFNKRFGSRFGQSFWNESRESLDEGMYITTLKYLVNIGKKIAGLKHDSVRYNELDIHTKRNIKRTIAELSSAMFLFALSSFLVKIIQGLDPEEDEYLGLYSLHYMTNRLKNEQLTWSFGASHEAKRLLQSPIASVGILSQMLDVSLNLAKLPIDEETLEELGMKSAYYQGGYKKGESKAAYSFRNLIPGVKTYQQYMFMDDSFEQRISQ